MSTRRHAFLFFVTVAIVAAVFAAAPTIAFADAGEAADSGMEESFLNSEPVADSGGGQSGTSGGCSACDADGAFAQIETEVAVVDAADGGISESAEPGATADGSDDGASSYDAVGSDAGVDAGADSYAGEGDVASFDVDMGSDAEVGDADDPNAAGDADANDESGMTGGEDVSDTAETAEGEAEAQGDAVEFGANDGEEADGGVTTEGVAEFDADVAGDSAGSGEGLGSEAAEAGENDATAGAVAGSAAVTEGVDAAADPDASFAGDVSSSDEGLGSEAAEVATDDATAGAVAGSAEVPEGIVAVAANAGQPRTLAETAAEGVLDDEEANVLLETAATASVSKSDILNLVQKLIVNAITGDPGKIAGALVDFGVGQLLNALFGTPVENKDETSMRDILEKLNLLYDSLTDLQHTVDSQQLDGIITGLQSRLNAQGLTPYIIFDTLKGYDDQQKAGTMKADVARAARLKALTTDLHIDEPYWASVNNDFDLYVQDLFNAMTQTYPVTIYKKPKDLTLMEVFYEHLRMKYHWENQAYDEWASYQARYVGLLMTSLSLEKASLQARIDLLKAKGERYDSIQTLLAITQDRINQVVGYKGKDSTGKKDVDYPGFFSEKTWASSYWMYKERDDSERYYWTPGHEILFYSEITTQAFPAESTSAGLQTGGLRDIGVQWYSQGSQVDYNVYINYLSLTDFLFYKNNAYLASADQLKTIFADYGGGTNFDAIFMSEDEGNFHMYDNHDYTDWRFVVSMDENHELVYTKKSGKADTLSLGVLTPGSKDESNVMWYYRFKSTEAGSGLHFVGVGVKRVGPEGSDPGSGNQNPQGDLRWYTEIMYPEDQALWRPSQGDLALGWSTDARVAVKKVLMDGKLLDVSCYTLEGNKIVLTQAYMSSLDYGEHEMSVDVENGNHVIVFSTQPDGVYYVESGEGSAWTSGASDDLTFVFKRTTDDGVTFVRLIDVLVDGASVPSWGYVAKAGSAIITLTSAFLDTLAPGTHALTAVFADGNDPQAAFTVRAASSAPQAVPVAYVGETAQPEGTPRTGDGTIFVMAFLALTALASAGVAARARRCA